MKEKFNALYEFIKKTIHKKHDDDFYDVVIDYVCAFNKNQKVGSDNNVIAWLYFGYATCCDLRDRTHQQVTDDGLFTKFATDLYLNLIEVPDAMTISELQEKYKDYDLAETMLNSLEQHVYAVERN